MGTVRSDRPSSSDSFLQILAAIHLFPMVPTPWGPAHIGAAPMPNGRSIRGLRVHIDMRVQK